MKISILLVPFSILTLVLLQNKSGPSSKIALPQEDRIRVAEVFRLGAAVDDKIWTEWTKAPFAVMLVTNDYEYLIGHPHATNNFDTLGYDPELNNLVLVRKRLFPTNLLATFPAINGLSTIVVGQAANTNVSSSTAWVITVLHEHFHQYQHSQPDYYASVNSLRLARGDNTGMWMLNYAFPYDSVTIDSAYAKLSRSLLKALQSKPRDMSKHLNSFLGDLGRFKLLLSPDDFNYFSFQCWQEGVARYTELRVAQLAEANFHPSESFRTLRDYKPFREVADSLRAKIMNGLSDPSLAVSRRVAFYSFGAGEALLLDRVRPHWKNEYLRTKFHLEKYFTK